MHILPGAFVAFVLVLGLCFNSNLNGLSFNKRPWDLLVSLLVFVGFLFPLYKQKQLFFCLKALLSAA